MENALKRMENPDYPRVNYEQQKTIEMDLRCKYSFHLKCAGQWLNCVNKSERIDTDNIRDLGEARLALGESCTGFTYSADAKYGYLKDCGSNPIGKDEDPISCHVVNHSRHHFSHIRSLSRSSVL